jgi:hypothetical protein
MKVTNPNAVVTVLIVLLCAAAAIGQDANHTKYDADKTLRSNARVNPSTLAMELSIPLPSYAGRAGNSVASSLEYSSKVWSSGSTAHYSTFLGPKTQIDPTFATRSASGWTSTMGVPMIDETVDGYTEGGLGWTYDAELPQSGDFPIVYVKRVRIVMPDGSAHELRADDGFHSYGSAFSPYVSEADKRSGVFLSVDGSRMRLEWTQTGTAWTNVLYMPDGGRFLNVPLFNAPSGTVDYFDRRGNKMSYSIANNQWTDTLGRTLTNPIPVYGESYNPAVGTPTFNYPTMPGHTAQSVQFVWEHLSSQQSTLSYTSTIYCTGNTGNLIPSGAPHLFTHFVSSDLRVCGTSSTFNPVVLTAVILPNGAKYSFHYNVYAEIDRIDYPTGGYERFVYDQMPAVAGNGDINYDQFNRGVADRYVSPDGTTGSEVHWHYEVEKETTSSTTGPYHVKTFAPDGSWSEQLIADRFNSLSVSFAFDTPGLGRAYETRVYDNTTDNNLLRRTLTSWTYTTGLTIGGVSPVTGAYRDYRPERQVSMIFEPGDTNALVSMTETVYDTGGSTDPAYFSSLNAKQAKTHNHKVVSASTAQSANIGTAAGWFTGTDVAAVAESDFLYDPNYQARNITGLVTESRIKDASGTVKAKTQYGYDEGTYSDSTSGTMPTAAAGSWIDLTASTQLGSTVGGKRGLPTTVKSFHDIAAGSYIETHGFFDQYGNLTRARDGRGFDTVTVYDDDYAFAYPTSVTTPAPGDGTQGSSTGFTASTVYDYNTGLPTSMTDANLQQTTIHEKVNSHKCWYLTT